MADLESIRQKIPSFRNEPDWAQFHYPKNLPVEHSIHEINFATSDGALMNIERDSVKSSRESRRVVIGAQMLLVAQKIITDHGGSSKDKERQ